eukprot:229300-Alexandrium_andersonii.AAC.1
MQFSQVDMGRRQGQQHIGSNSSSKFPLSARRRRYLGVRGPAARLGEQRGLRGRQHPGQANAQGSGRARRGGDAPFWKAKDRKTIS